MKVLNLIIWLWIYSGVTAQPQNYTITSDIKNLDSDHFSITIWGRGKSESKDKILLTNGQIRYSDTTSVPLMIRITPADKRLIKRARAGYYPVKSQSIWLVAMPGSSTKLVGHLSDFSEVYPTGGRENEILCELTKNYFPIINESVNMKVELNRKSSGLSAKEIKSKEKKQQALNKKAAGVLLSFLKKYPSSVSGLYFLEDTYIRKGIDFSTLKYLMSEVEPSYHGYQFYKTIKSRIEADQYKAGNQIMAISSDRTPDGNLFTTASWEGKFYLIDFWGSWCVPCISDFPNVKSLKSDLKDKIEILGIASDKEENWRRAIDSYNLGWQHILIGTGEQNFAALLDVRGYPTKILVAPDGEILYKGSGSGKESFEKVRKIIKEWKSEGN